MEKQYFFNKNSYFSISSNQRLTLARFLPTFVTIIAFQFLKKL